MSKNISLGLCKNGLSSTSKIELKCPSQSFLDRPVSEPESHRSIYPIYLQNVYRTSP